MIEPEGLSDRAKHAVRSAADAARADRGHLSTGALLLGLLADKDCVASRLLTRLCVSHTEITLQIRKITRSATKGAKRSHAALSFDAAARQALELAFDEARRMESRRVGTEHVLLGLLREEKGEAARVLVGVGLTLDSARRELAGLLRADAARRAI